MAAKYAHLHVHSHYSLLKALPKIGDLVARAKAEGIEALALCDIDNLYGAIEFYKECKGAGIKPIIGVDAHVGDGVRTLLFAENKTGYLNLMQLVTKAHLSNPELPTMTAEMLAEHGAGVIRVDPADSSYALREIYYLSPDDRRAWEVMRAIANRGPLDEGDITQGDDDYYFPATAEMEQWYTQEQLAKTLELAARCNVELELGKWVFPNYPLPQGSSYNDELRKAIEEGIKTRGLGGDPAVRERVEYEYKIITDKGYAPYFLVVADLLRFARENGILTTIRGSVALCRPRCSSRASAIGPHDDPNRPTADRSSWL